MIADCRLGSALAVIGVQSTIGNRQSSMLSLFANPFAMIAGALLISSPIIIHLINRMRYKRIRFAAMEFLLKSQKRSRRKLIIEQMILLALRILMVLLIGLLLARFVGCEKGGTEGRPDLPPDPDRRHAQHQRLDPRRGRPGPRRLRRRQAPRRRANRRDGRPGHAARNTAPSFASRILVSREPSAGSTRPLSKKCGRI